MPSTLIPPFLSFLGISTARTGPGKYEPDAIRFHSLNRLPWRPSSNCSIVTPSAPAAPPFSLTFSHASHTRRLGLSYDLPSSFDSRRRLLPCGWPHRLAWIAPPLGSTHAAIRASFTATTGGSASAPGNGTRLLAVSAAWRSPSRCVRHRSSVRTRLHTFHRSA